jgi:uracil-DNA glycosylase
MYTCYTDFNTSKEKCRQCPVGLIYNRVVCSVGNTTNPIYMIVGEAPGRDEVEKGQPFVGKAGQLLREMLIKYGLTKKNTLITNTIPCRPENNIFPNDPELIAKCMNMWLLEEIQLAKPKCILCVGATPMKYVLGIRDAITRVRGKVFESLSPQHPPGSDEFSNKYNINAKAIATFHPSYIIRNGNTELGTILKQQFESDIAKFKLLPESADSGLMTF